MKDLKSIDWNSFLPAPVIGVDEVGRGCLAGPVYAAAVIMKSPKLSRTVTDSKLLSELRREQLFSEILEHHHAGIGFATVEEIDELNILHASLLAMKRAVENLVAPLQINSGHILVDGHMTIPGIAPEFLQTPLVKGDLRAAPISAASIVAKVTRDRWMKELALEYPQYGFEIHKGYGTPTHKQCLQRHGPSPFHRRGFAGVKEFYASVPISLSSTPEGTVG